MRAHIHDGREPMKLHLKAGYIGARPECFTLTNSLLQRTAGPYIWVTSGRADGPVGTVKVTL